MAKNRVISRLFGRGRYYRRSFQLFAEQIAENRGEQPYSKAVALRKMFVQERRIWEQEGVPHIGWKRGEIIEFVEALVTGGNWREEWGDVGYYAAQTFGLVWWLYYLLTPGKRVNPMHATSEDLARAPLCLAREKFRVRATREKR